ncbi:histone deacetylase family protein [Chelatococcus reniformis]|uniref:histone deacetylase family protein n=1 Tax=Chelatococcus reniformis TaxID=1494448 RepID=UPI001662D8D0|nr:histone deacetylase family protein [Chelatococcus reniformis]
MSTLYLTHPACLDHETPLGHPECAERLRAVERALEQEKFALLLREQAPLGSREAIHRVHPERYVEAIEQATPRSGIVHIDGDTALSRGSFEAALRGVGAAVRATDEVMAGRVGNAFCATRPPGHHAERAQAMGFCLFNNVAIAARHARTAHGAGRVAIVDWDVHHGNGTQDIFWSDPDVLYCSTHEMPLYPGTGAMSEQGEHDTIVNVPLPAGTNSRSFREAFDFAILPRLEAFKADLIIISAGFDAHWRDPLANLNLTEADFAWATLRLMAIADSQCKGRIVSMLEGGYDLDALAKSTAGHVEALMGM